MSNDLTQAHQWTNGGTEVLLVKCVAKDGRSYNNFKWPLTVGATVEAPDWSHEPKYGGGLHGWPWGTAIGDGKDPDYSGTWIVFGSAPETVISIEGKAKCKSATIRFVGGWKEALAFIRPGWLEWIKHRAVHAGANAGDMGSANAGNRGSANAGDSSVARAGLGSKARAGLGGCIAILFACRGKYILKCAPTGSGKGSLKANVWYTLDKRGKFKEVTE